MSDIDDAVEETVEDAVEDAVEEVVEEVETIADAIIDVAERTAEAFTTDDQHSDNVALIVGALSATVEALKGEVAQLRSDVETTRSIAEMADNTAVDALVVAEEVRADEIIDEIIETEPEPVEEDQSPPTKRQRLSDWWFGKPQT